MGITFHHVVSALVGGVIAMLGWFVRNLVTRFELAQEEISVLRERISFVEGQCNARHGKED